MSLKQRGTFTIVPKSSVPKERQPSSVMHIARMTGPDILTAVGILCEYFNNYTEAH
jgi:hypothetical protein